MDSLKAQQKIVGQGVAIEEPTSGPSSGHDILCRASWWANLKLPGINRCFELEEFLPSSKL